MIRAVDCEGAPRDLGRDQGVACGEDLRARFARGDRIARWRNRLGFVDAGVGPVDRGLWRYFPHQAETVRGLAAAAGVPAAWLVSEFTRFRADSVPVTAMAKPAQLARGLAGRTLVRRNRPDGLFASVDVALHGVPAPLIGVNERGFAVAVLPGRAERNCAPAWFLGKDCLERFEALEPAIEWCARRTGAAGGGLVLVDARGGMAAVHFASELRIERPSDGRFLSAPIDDDNAFAQAVSDAQEIDALAEVVDGACVDVAEGVLSVGGERFSL